MSTIPFKTLPVAQVRPLSSTSWQAKLVKQLCDLPVTTSTMKGELDSAGA